MYVKCCVANAWARAQGSGPGWEGKAGPGVVVYCMLRNVQYIYIYMYIYLFIYTYVYVITYTCLVIHVYIYTWTRVDGVDLRVEQAYVSLHAALFSTRCVQDIRKHI